MAGGRSNQKPGNTIQNVLLVVSVLVCVDLAAGLSEEFPEFLEQPRSKIISQNSQVTLKCSALPKDAQIAWLFDGQPLDERRHRELKVEGSNLVFLNEDGVDDSSSGEYRCTATSPKGTIVSQPALVSKPALHRFTPVDDVTIVVPEGGYATLTCEPPKSSPPALVFFQTSNGELVDTTSDAVQQLPSGNVILTNLTSGSAGDFRCVAVNPLSGEKRISQGATFLVIDRTLSGTASAVSILPGIRQKVQAEIGSDVILDCPSYGHQEIRITWSKHGGSLPVGRFSLSAFGNLQIVSSQFEDSGTYTCTSSSNDKMERQVFLEIITPPVVQVVKRPEATVAPGSRVEMECSVAGLPKPELEWYHNGILLTSSGGGHLVLARVSPADSGLYQCMASNKLGTDFRVMMLEVEGQQALPIFGDDSLLLGDDEDTGASSGGGKFEDKIDKSARRDRQKTGRRKQMNAKDRRKKNKNGTGVLGDKEKPKYAPSVPTVTQLSDRSAMLNWSVPDKGNGQTIKFFKIQFKEMSPERGPWRTSDAHLDFHVRKFEVSDLKSGGSYRFRILAVYEDDDNKNSANTAIFRLSVQPNVHARSPDTAPTIVEAKPVVFQQNYGIGVKWQYKAESASPIEGFIIFYKPFGASEDKEKVIPGAGIRNDVIRDLLPNTPYNIRMQSFNSIGRSQFSNQVVKTTKLRDSSIVDDYPELEIPLKEPEASSETPVSGRRSSETLENPVILGVVLGALLLALCILVTMCWWKQRQQKRRSLTGSFQQKNQEQSQCIFADGSHTKPNGSLYPANGSVVVANGRTPLHPEGHKHLNIDINPLAEYDIQATTPGDGRSKLFYGNGINGTVHRFTSDSGCSENKFQSTGSTNHHGCNGEIPFMVRQKSLYSMQHCPIPHNSNTFYSETSTLGLSLNHEYSEPTDREHQTPGFHHHSLYKQNIDQHGNSLRNYEYSWSGPYDQAQIGVSHYSSLERISPLYCSTSVDFSGKVGVCQHHGKHQKPPMISSQTSHVLASNFGTVPGCVGPTNQSHHGKPRRRWKRGRDQAAREHEVKDQATNTDHSSNEGTLEYSTYPKSETSSTSESDVGRRNRDSSFTNNGSLESINSDSSSCTGSHESDLNLPSNIPASL